MSEVARSNGHVDKWITDRKPTAYDANGGGAVRIRKYPNGSSSAAVYWGFIGDSVPWQRCNDWVDREDEIIPELPSIEHSDEWGNVLAWTDKGSVETLFYSLVLPWMGWEPLRKTSNIQREELANIKRYWISNTLPPPGFHDADANGNVMIVAYGQMPIHVPWDSLEGRQYYGWTHTNQYWNDRELVEPQSFQRLFISISRSFGPRGEHYIDAVASDGTAWYCDMAEKESGWLPHGLLPPAPAEE